METGSHKIIDMVEQSWPYISGIAITIVGAVRLWWYSRQEIKNRITNLEIMAEHFASQGDLNSHKKELLDNTGKHVEKLYEVIREANDENSRQHQDMLKQVMRLLK